MVRPRHEEGGAERARKGARTADGFPRRRALHARRRSNSAEVGRMKPTQQTTLRTAVALEGIGVHSGDEARVVLHPAEANHGIAFLRTGLPGGRERLIDARHLSVTATELCTVIGDRDSGAVATVEHLMSALYGLGIDNVLVEIDGPELPILDGSAAPFVDAIDQVGAVTLGVSGRSLKARK